MKPGEGYGSVQISLLSCLASIFTSPLCHGLAIENLLRVVDLCPTVSSLYLFLSIPILTVC